MRIMLPVPFSSPTTVLVLIQLVLVLTSLFSIVVLTRALETREEFLRASSLRALSVRGGTYLITGATAGIGLALASSLAEADGVRVLIGARDAARGADAVAAVRRAAGPRSSVSLVLVDVASAASVCAAVEALAAKGERVDVLVANAGAMDLRGLRWLTLVRALLTCRMTWFFQTGRAATGTPHFLDTGNDARGALATHVIGHAALAMALASRAPLRVVWSGSRAADLGAVEWGADSPQERRPRGALPRDRPSTSDTPLLPSEAYSGAKAVVDLFSRALNARGIASAVVCPGFVVTSLAPPFFVALAPLFVHTRGLVSSFALTPRRGAIVHLATLAAAPAWEPDAKYVLENGRWGRAVCGATGGTVALEARAEATVTAALNDWAAKEGGARLAVLPKLAPERCPTLKNKTRAASKGRRI